MNDTFAGPLTAFDAVALTIIIVSGLMALARGFLRELATLVAFVAALAAAYYARLFLRPVLEAAMPEGLPSWTPDAILVLGAFVIVYVALSIIGGRISKHIQGVDGVGVINRLAGLVFGVARGVVVMVGFVLVINLALPQERLPRQIVEARLYPYFAQWAQAVRDVAPKLADQASSLIPEASSAGGEANPPD